jgi:hypothetical protein
VNTFHALKYLYLERNKFGRCLKKSYLSGRCYLPRSKLPTFFYGTVPVVHKQKNKINKSRLQPLLPERYLGTVFNMQLRFLLHGVYLDLLLPGGEGLKGTEQVLRLVLGGKIVQFDHVTKLIDVYRRVAIKKENFLLENY